MSEPPPSSGRSRRQVLLRLDPAVHDALARWAAEELRSTNSQIEYLLRGALLQSGRMPHGAKGMRGPGRPRREEPDSAGEPDQRGTTS